MSPLQLFWSYFEPLGIAPFANRHSSVKLVRRVWFGLLRRLRSLATHRSAASAAESPDVTEWDLLGAVCDDRREELKRLVAAQSGSESEVQTEREDHFATLTQPRGRWNR
jgi:hypothetical protein